MIRSNNGINRDNIDSNAYRRRSRDRLLERFFTVFNPDSQCLRSRLHPNPGKPPPHFPFLGRFFQPQIPQVHRSSVSTALVGTSDLSSIACEAVDPLDADTWESVATSSLIISIIGSLPADEDDEVDDPDRLCWYSSSVSVSPVV